MSKKSTIYALALLAGLCAAAISFFAPFFPYGADSACYIQQARSFMERGVFEVTPFNQWGANVETYPDNLFPPGYPLLIAIGSMLLQLPAEVIAPFLSLAALIFLPVLIVFSFHRVVGLLPALWIGILVVLTPAAVRHGYIAYSDTLSLALAVYSVHRLLAAGNKAAGWFWLGLLTGFSYVLRNANLGLLLSIFLYLPWRLIVEPENRRAIINNGLSWLGGSALMIVPLLIRNVLVFGKMQPYSMDPSLVGLSENIHDYFQAQLDTLLASGGVDKLLADSPWAIVLLLMAAVVFVGQVVTTWQRWQTIEQKTFFIAVVYAAIGAAMVIAARTKYQWGVHIDGRYALPYSCFIFVALVIAFKNTTLKINTRYVGLGLAAALLITRAFELPTLYKYSKYNQAIMAMANHIKANQEVICNNAEGRVVVSNDAFVYRALCPVQARDAPSPMLTKQISQ